MAARQKIEREEDSLIRNKERTKRLILQAATEEFAKNGFAGARVENIAQISGSNKRMLYYYFQNKEGLFVAVMEEAYKSIRDAESTLKLLDMNPEEAMIALIRFTWDYYTKHPEFLSLLNSENLYHADHIKKSDQIGRYNSRVINTLKEVIARGIDQKVFRPDIDPLQLYISIAALSYFYLSNNSTLSVVFSSNLLSKKAREERLRHMIDLILSYLKFEGTHERLGEIKK